MAEQPILEVKGLEKYFEVRNGYLHAVDGVTFSINKGETLGVVGESGCGKSTLGRTLLHLHESTGGQIFFKGEDITRVDRARLSELRHDMQFIFQDPFASLNPRKTVFQTIAEPLQIAAKHNHMSAAEIEQKVYEMMDTVGLARRLVNTYPHELDGGRRQRIGIGRALILDPDFVVCDEPVSALDVSIQAQIINLLLDIQEKKGITYIFITHDLSVVRYISDNIMVMYLGECIELADKNDLFQAPLHPYTKALLAAVPVADVHHEKTIIPLKGELTSPINPKKGCRFAKRCTYARPECSAETPELEEIQPKHFVACRFVKEINNL